MTDKEHETAENSENETIKRMQERLQEIKNQEGVIGYILRGDKSASIDLKDPTKIIDYAILSSSTFEAAEELAEILQIGEPKKILLESEETKLLSMNSDSHRLSVFMEKAVDHKSLLKSLK